MELAVSYWWRLAGEALAICYRASPGYEARLTPHSSLIVSGEPIADLNYAVIDQDGAVHLPEEWAEDYPPGSLVEFEETDDGFFVRRVDMTPPGEH